jgi:hypothetical protein
MAYEQKVDTGSVFVNDRKDSDRHPDRSGSALLQCPHCRKTWSTWISGWIKESETKGKWLSLAFKPKGEKPQPTTSKMQPRSMKDELDEGDEIPF